MKAFTIIEPGKYNFVDNLSIPVIENDHVLLKVKKVGLCGSDLNTFRGNNPIVNFPRIPGHEIAAEIVNMGPGVPEEINIGDKVSVLPYTSCGECHACLMGKQNACQNNQTMGNQRDGGLTEYISVPYQKIIIGLNDLSFEKIAIVEPLAVGFHAAGRAELQNNETLLVFGCGMVGLGVIAKASLSGIRIIAVDIDDSKLKLATKMGATHTINSTVKDLKKEVFQLTGDHGADVTLEAVGLNETFLLSIELTSYGGRVVYVGYAKKPIEYETKNFIMKEIQIRGARNAERKDFEDVLRVIRSSKLPFDDLITSVVPFNEAGEAFKYWDSNPGKVSKILVSLE